MTDLIIILLVAALVAALAWGARLRQALDELPEPAAPEPEAQTPLAPLYNALVESVDLGVVVVSANGHISSCNSRALQLFERQLDEVLGRSTIVLLRDYQSDMLIQQALEQREVRSTILHPVLSRHTISLHCVPVAASGLLLLIRDLTQLNQLERSRRDLIINVSHELRTPLAAMHLLVETLQSEPPAEVAARMLKQIEGEIHALNRLVDELYELSQIESGRLAMQFRPVAPGALVTRALERIGPLVERQGIELATEVESELPKVLVDQERMDQVLLNLLSNAVKFTPSGGRICLRAAPASQPQQFPDQLGQWVELVVSDNGVGIPAGDLPRVFERFYKVDRARTRGRGGMGLGLAIAKHLVEGHGGAIWAESTLGQGSAFHVVLPAAE